MSQNKSRYEAERWLLTAQEDWEAAKSLQEAGKFSVEQKRTGGAISRLFSNRSPSAALAAQNL